MICKFHARAIARRRKARFPLSISLRSKRFRLVSEQKRTEERDFRFWPREKWNETQKMKEGGGGGEGRKLPFFPTPSPLFYLPYFLFFPRSLTLVPRPLLLTAQKRLLRRLFKHVQNIICNQTQLDGVPHEQTIICRQLFAGHAVDPRPMKRKKNLLRMISRFHCQ